MKLKRDTFECPICCEILKEPVECLNCNNNFCKECVQKIIEKSKEKNTEDKCPLCSTSPFLCKQNFVLDNLLSKKNNCKICGETFNKLEQLEIHMKTCKKFICFLCNQSYNGKDNFFNHFLESNHKNSIIKIMNRFKQSERQQILLYYEKEVNKPTLTRNELLFAKIKKNKTKNINLDLTSSVVFSEKSNSDFNLKSQEYEEMSFREKSNKLNNIYYQFLFEDLRKSQSIENIPSYNNNDDDEFIHKIISNISDTQTFVEECDLFYCFKNNNLDCKCCEDHICKPGNCFCLKCMNLNKKFHQLKTHFLINKEGRGAKYSNNTYQCNFSFQIKQQVGNNIFSKKIKCNYRNPCKACRELTVLMNKYLPKNLVDKLRMLK